MLGQGVNGLLVETGLTLKIPTEPMGFLKYCDQPPVDLTYVDVIKAKEIIEVENAPMDIISSPIQVLNVFDRIYGGTDRGIETVKFTVHDEAPYMQGEGLNYSYEGILV